MSSTKEGNPPILMKVKNPEMNERSEPRPWNKLMHIYTIYNIAKLNKVILVGFSKYPSGPF
jgi:hypothetical protein